MLQALWQLRRRLRAWMQGSGRRLRTNESLNLGAKAATKMEGLPGGRSRFACELTIRLKSEQYRQQTGCASDIWCHRATAQRTFGNHNKQDARGAPSVRTEKTPLHTSACEQTSSDLDKSMCQADNVVSNGCRKSNRSYKVKRADAADRS